MKLKKLLCMLLCIAMVLSTMGTVAFAEETYVTATDITDETDLDYAVRFDVTDLMDSYTSTSDPWRVDVILTSNTDLTLDSRDDTKDGYLSVHLPSMDSSMFVESGWRNLPTGGMLNSNLVGATVEAGKPFKVMEYYLKDSGLGSANGLNYYELISGTYNYNGVECGLKLNEAIDGFSGEIALVIYQIATIDGVKQDVNHKTLASYTFGEDSDDGEEIDAVAEVNGVGYETIEATIAAAKAGDEIVLLADVEGDINVPADVKFNGNGFAVNGTLYALGDITFAGNTKIATFDFENVGTEINIGAGACLEITGTGRMVIGHGCTFNIEGNIENAKTVNIAELTPSLIMPGASFTGAGVTFNVKNAYIKTTASYCSSSKTASGTFDFNIENSIWDQVGKLAFEEQSTAATVNFDLKDSVLTTTSHLVFGVSRGEIVIDNSNVNVGTARQIENQSTMTIKNGSVVNGAVATSSNAKNPGTIIVEDATYAVTGEFSGSDLGTGTIIVNKDATFSAGSITKANIIIDATGMTAGEATMITADLSKFAGELSVINNTLGAKIENGKIVLDVKPVAKVGDAEYETVAEALLAAAEAGAAEVKILTSVRELLTTDLDVVLKADLTITADSAVTVDFYNNGTTYDLLLGGTNGEDLTIAENVTLTVSDRIIWVGYHGNNIDVIVNGKLIGGSQLWFGGDVTVSETGTVGSKGEALVGRRNAKLTINGGTLDANYFSLTSGTVELNNATATTGPLWLSSNSEGAGHIILNNSNLTSKGNLKMSGEASVTVTGGSELNITDEYGYGASVIGEGCTLTIDTTSSVTSNAITGTGAINIDASDFDGTTVPVLNTAGMSGFTGNVSVVNNSDADYAIGDDGTITIIKKPVKNVAEVNGVGFETLASAIANAKEGDTITILAGTISEGAIKLPATLKNVTFKGETGAILKDMTIMASDGNSFSYVGLTFDGITFENSRISFTGWRNGEEVIEDLTITNCTFKDLYDATNVACVHINKDASEPVNGFTFTNNVIDGATGGSKSGIYTVNTGDVVITGNTFNNIVFRPALVQLSDCDGTVDNVVISDNVFSNTTRLQVYGTEEGPEEGPWTPAGTDTLTIAINNNIFKNITGYYICTWGINGDTDIAENYYDSTDLGGRIYWNNEKPADETGLAELGVYPVYTELKADGTIDETSAYTPAKPVAKIGETKYTTLAAAISEANGKTVTVLENIDLNGKAVKIPAGAEITLDLNGKAISDTCNTSSGNMIYVENTAKLTIKDSSSSSDGKITYASGTSNVGWTIAVMGELVLDSGTIELTGNWSIGYAVDVRPNAWGTPYAEGTDFTMNGGKIVSSDGAVRVASSSADTYPEVSASFTMNGGKIDAAWDGVFVQQSNAIWDTLSVTINGGSIESDLNPVRFYGPAATSYVKGEDCVDITLNGGTLTYTGTETRTWIIDGILRIGGGVTVEDFMKDTTVSASASFAQSNVAEGYTWVETNGVYTLAKAETVNPFKDSLLFVGDLDAETYDGNKYYPVYVSTSVDSLKYSKVGFKYTFTRTEDNVEKVTSYISETKNVYNSISDANTTYTIESVGGNGKYLFMDKLLFSESAYNNGNTKITITPYAYDFNGNEITGWTFDMTNEVYKAFTGKDMFKEEN